MRLFFKQPDISFAGDEAHTFLPWLVGIMAGLTAFLLCLGITVNHWVVNRESSYSNSFAVSIPAEFADQKETIARQREILEKTEGVAQVSEIPREKLQDMLKPWLGGHNASADLPLPVVFDVSLTTSAASVNVPQLQKRLAALAPGTEIDTQEHWAQAFTSFSDSIKYLSFLLATLLVGSMFMTVAFSSRASLKLHMRTVLLLHSIGAEDRYITNQFQQEAFRLVLPAAFAGCMAAGIGYWCVGTYMASLRISVMPAIVITQPHAALLLLMPLLCAFTAWVVARIAITTQLQNTL